MLNKYAIIWPHYGAFSNKYVLWPTGAFHNYGKPKPFFTHQLRVCRPAASERRLQITNPLLTARSCLILER